MFVVHAKLLKAFLHDKRDEVARVETNTSTRGGAGTSDMDPRETGTILKKKNDVLYSLGDESKGTEPGWAEVG